MNPQLEKMMFTPHLFNGNFDNKKTGNEKDNNNETINNKNYKTTTYNLEDFIPYKPHRTFTFSQKELCWNKANIIPKRDKNRWRFDPLGNPVMKQLRGCMGPLCHEYDHILPHSKGGETILGNCQILQTIVNRKKGNNYMLSEKELDNFSIKVNLTDKEMDFMEMMIYGNIKHII